MTDGDERAVRVRLPARIKDVGSAPSSPTVEPPTLDALDLQLVSHLMQNGRLGNRALAGMVAVSEVTVGSRLRRLVAKNILVFTAVIDWEAAGYDWFVICRITVTGRDPVEVARQVGAVPGCIAASAVFGAADVLGYFLVADRAEVRDLLGARLDAVEGISRVAADIALATTVTMLGETTFLAVGTEDLRLPRPVVSMDALDVAIVELLMEDGRQSNRRISRTLSVSEGTVRTRLGRLLDAKLVKLVAMVNPVAVGMAGLIAHLAIQVRRDLLHEVTSKVSTIAEVAVAATTIGSADLHVVLAVADHAQLVGIVQRSVRSLNGVLDVDVLEMIDIVRFDPFLKHFPA
ncbi:Lrp/AsnC family transcriptional regulator [Pseudonocardia sp. GCM10023141]|uniref:Lrp/AsnC family transcriptional regulator n=1 Tax=Pseudonocardia sp. GCM10023141 TaxID=3252653 RepID=UPI003606CECA